MKTIWNFLLVLTLLVMLVGASASVAQAEGILTISPTTLPDGTYRTSYSQQLTASGGSGSYTFRYSGAMPNGMGLYSTGKLEGYPLDTGTFTFTALVSDVQDPSLTGSQQITLVIGTGTPTVTVWTVPEFSTYGQEFTIWAASQIPPSIYPGGTFAFYVDDVDTPIPGCESVPMGTPAAYCSSPEDLGGGEHTLKAVYTPDTYWSKFLNSATGTVTHTVGYKITGTLFNDTNKNGMWDAGEVINESWLEVKLDQGCDGVTEYTDSDWTPEKFEFLNLLPGTYCLSVNLSNYYIQTTNMNPITLDGNQTLEVGLFHPEFEFSPDVLPDAQLGAPYSQKITLASGATAPYTITMVAVSSNLPNGMTFDEGTDTLSGTPTQAGDFQLNLIAQDATGVIQGHDYWFKVRADGTFNFTSSANPSVLGAEVTFTLSATGDVVLPGSGPFPPVGVVTFNDDGTAIVGCSNLYLNYDDGNETSPIGNYPAVCTTSALPAGSHIITAVFTDWPKLYNDVTLTLTQQVGTSIAPASLPDAFFNTTYSQQLTASGGTEPYTFSLSGTLPYGITLNSSGLLSGFPDGTNAKPGTYPITIQVQDANSVVARRTYDFVVDKGTPTVTASASAYIYWKDPFNLWAQVEMKRGDGSAYLLPGTVAFTIDGEPVPGCEAVPYLNGNYLCEEIPMNLSVGPHTVMAAYTPTGGYADYYYPANASSVFTVQPGSYAITGSLFEDKDQDGEWDVDDSDLLGGWTINLDQGCDETVDETFTTYSYTSYYAFYGMPGGKCYRISVVEKPGWQRTTPLADFWLSEGIYSTIGYYYPTITLSPGQLSSGSVGVEYYQELTASGGAEPYKYTSDDGYWPDGLTLSEEGILSGTPTEAGVFNLALQAEDTNQAAVTAYYLLTIKTDAVFTFTSSPNPSAAGEAVTFTVSATGEAFHFYAGLIPPAGTVTFFAGGTPIEGCSDLNLNWSEGQYADSPATCTTTTLGTGSHEITATYTDFSGIFNTSSLALTQVVNSVDLTPPVITPTITGTEGQNEWYTSDVSITWEVTDDESEITSTSGCDPVAITSDQPWTEYYCTASSAGGERNLMVYILRDATKPVVTVSGLTDGATYVLGSVPAAGCTTSDDLSGTATAAALTLSGGDALGLGSITATCSGALDKAGNAGDPASVQYTVTAPTSADLSITKTDSKDPVKPGAQLVYTLVVNNTGPDAAQSVVVADKLDSNTSYVSVSAPRGWNCRYTANNATVTCTGASLAAGSSVTLKITVTVKKTARIGKELVNNATITSATYDPVVANNTVVQKTLVIK